MRLGKLITLLPRIFGGGGYLNRKGVIFIVSHMRGYTTLLSHLMGTHPDVAGYAEAHQKYRNALDFVELADKIEKSGANPPAGRYLLDKILHPLEISPNVLGRPDLAMLVMVRPPAATLRSILEGRHGGLTTVEAAADYYLASLERMRAMIGRRAGRVLFIDADALVSRPESSLDTISDYLGLTPKLTTNYRTFPYTGRPKYGDASQKIATGRIDARRDTAVLAPMHPCLAGVERAYLDFRAFALEAAERTIRCPRLDARSGSVRAADHPSASPACAAPARRLQ